MPNKQNNSLIVQLRSVHIVSQPEASWPTEAGSGGVGLRIDSVLPQISLPLEACLMFEKAFGLSWNDTLQLYLVDEYTHTILLQTNPSVSFEISGGLDGVSQNFVLPYSAFDLQVTSPFVESTLHYFLSNAQQILRKTC